jgi:hypothetical protein
MKNELGLLRPSIIAFSWLFLVLFPSQDPENRVSIHRPSHNLPCSDGFETFRDISYDRFVLDV